MDKNTTTVTLQLQAEGPIEEFSQEIDDCVKYEKRESSLPHFKYSLLKLFGLEMQILLFLMFVNRTWW